jgi:hypothetical protein
VRKTRKKKKDSATTFPKGNHEGERVALKYPELNKVTVTASQMTSEQERHWQSALALLFDAMVRQEIEGKDRKK